MQQLAINLKHTHSSPYLLLKLPDLEIGQHFIASPRLFLHCRGNDRLSSLRSFVTELRPQTTKWSTDYGTTYTKLNLMPGTTIVVTSFFICPTNKKKTPVTPGMQPSATLPTSTHLYSVKFSFDILPGMFSLLENKPSLVKTHWLAGQSAQLNGLIDGLGDQ
ncbi:hypothetical protein PAMA_014098 [Pampus argenteus]